MGLQLLFPVFRQLIVIIDKSKDIIQRAAALRKYGLQPLVQGPVNQRLIACDQRGKDQPLLFGIGGELQAHSPGIIGQYRFGAAGGILVIKCGDGLIICGLYAVREPVKQA